MTWRPHAMAARSSAVHQARAEARRSLCTRCAVFLTSLPFITHRLALHCSAWHGCCYVGRRHVTRRRVRVPLPRAERHDPDEQSGGQPVVPQRQVRHDLARCVSAAAASRPARALARRITAACVSISHLVPQRAPLRAFADASCVPPTTTRAAPLAHVDIETNPSTGCGWGVALDHATGTKNETLGLDNCSYMGELISGARCRLHVCCAARNLLRSCCAFVLPFNDPFASPSCLTVAPSLPPHCLPRPMPLQRSRAAA